MRTEEERSKQRIGREETKLKRETNVEERRRGKKR